MSSMLDYLHTYHHWQQKSYRGDNAYGPCPFHQGMTLKWGQKPDFVIYPPQHSRKGDWHAKCYGASCEISCDFTGLVWRLEFPEIDRDDKVGWATKIYPRMAELGEPVHPPRREPLPLPPRREEKPEPTEEQKTVLTAAMTWWNWVLTRLSDGAPGEQWLRSRGILPHYPYQVGYAPRMTTELWMTFDEMVRANLGQKNWYDLGVSTGVLLPSGKTRLQERVVFSCTNDEGKSVFYQARTIHPPDQQRMLFLNPSLAKTRGFHIPVKDPMIKGVVVTESPKGPAILAQYHISSRATLGAGLPSSLLAGVNEGPVYVATDNDAPRVDRRTGEVFFAGNDLAEKIMRAADRAGLRAYRILPPKEYKDVDAWVAAVGIDPILAAIEKARVGD